MKILIVAPSRVGGNVFSRWVSHELDLKWINEPFHEYQKELFDINKITKNDFVMKVNPYDWNKKYENDNDFFKIFDKIIGLTRDNLNEVAISFLKAVEQNNFTETYKLDETWVEQNEDNIKNTINDMKNGFDYTKNIPNSLQITYENIYITKTDIQRVVDYLGINKLKYYDMLDYKNRYRNNTNPKKII